VFPGRQRNIWADSHVSIAPFHSLACLGKSLDNSLVFTCVSLYSRSETLHLAAYPARDRAVRRVWHGVLTAYGSEGWGFESLRARQQIRKAVLLRQRGFFAPLNPCCEWVDASWDKRRKKRSIAGTLS